VAKYKSGAYLYTEKHLQIKLLFRRENNEFKKIK